MYDNLCPFIQSKEVCENSCPKQTETQGLANNTI